MIKIRISDGLSAMGVTFDQRKIEQLARYHELLCAANEKMNLTRVDLSDPIEAADHHYLDAAAPLAIPGLLDGAKSMIDVGSGAGLPGVPLGILLPEIHVVLLDSLQKRVAFLNEMIAELRLNAEAIHARAEDAGRNLALREKFDVVTARAVSSLNTLLELTLPFAKPGGCLIAYKGPSLSEELAASQNALTRLGGGKPRIYPVSIPGRDWDHRLLAVQKLRATPPAFPRKPAEMKKNPL